MSEFRPHVRKGGMIPSIKDKSLLVGKEDLTPQERAEWLRKQPKEVREHSEEMGRRYELIQKAMSAGLLGWELDYRHYRDGSPYCKCPAVGEIAAGTVAAHNARFDAILEQMNDGR